MNIERTIRVADSKTQKSYTLRTNAATLGELKQCLSDNHIDYTGMSFTEGITKTTLIDDNAPLPTNIPYKGTTTNNLMLLLTNTRKNIASGSFSRKDAYELIKKYNLQDAVKAKYGRNFTQVPTESLGEIIANYTRKAAPAKADTTEAAPEKKLASTLLGVEDHSTVGLIESLCKGLYINGTLTIEDIQDLSDRLLDISEDDVIESAVL